MNNVLELFGKSTSKPETEDWAAIAGRQYCPYLDRKCIKVRKSVPAIAIGSCSVVYSQESKALIICPHRFLDRQQIFVDSLHLLSNHEPGNELHVISEVAIPGGSVDYFIASVRAQKIKDFVGLEIQALDTTGTVWPARQSFLMKMDATEQKPDHSKTFGINWKMTAKTTLIQLHHKIRTFDSINKHLVIALQDYLLAYLGKAFNIEHFSEARRGDALQIHSYTFEEFASGRYRFHLGSRLSTDSQGVAIALGLRTEAKVELEQIVHQLEARISSDTLLRLS